jgi:hypothetical protein
MRSFSITLAAFALAACAADDAFELEIATQPVALADDPLLEQLEALPGVTVTELAPRPDARQFQLLITQPLDHNRPDGATFQQRVMLRSRGVALPMSLGTTGYGLFGDAPRDSEISFLLRANSLMIEHRFFEGSVPEGGDPKFLTIRQAAADHHRVVELLRPIYTGKWISTGASKGGMTSVYHRRFYPNDVDATVAYVAPQSYTADDPRYGTFLARVGSAACRQRIIDTQRLFLDRRAELVPIFEQQAAEQGFTFNIAGGLEVLFEHAVEEFRFALWQYFDEEFCAELPGADQPAEVLAAYLDAVAGPASLASDQTLEQFGAYYFQAATQLGSYGPLALESGLRGRLQHPGTYRVARYSTLPVTRVDLLSVPEVQLWLALHGQRIMFIYGENDPWSAGAFTLGFARDSFRYVVPSGNHGSSLRSLPEAERAEAFATLARWTGVQPTLEAPPTARGASAIDDDSNVDRERRLPL